MNKKLAVSPYNKKWHVHINVSDSEKYMLNKHLFLLLATKVWKLLPITTMLLNDQLSKSSYYLNAFQYIQFYSWVIKMRVITSTLDWILFIKQKGTCPYCNIPFLPDKYEFTTDKIIKQNVEDLNIFFLCAI